MPTIGQIEEYLETVAPLCLAEAWDNVGLLVNACDSADRVLISLDITQEAVAAARRLQCGLIVSHHPVIFKPLADIDKNDVVAQLIKHDISAICMHTNLDAACGGVNDVLAHALYLTDTQELQTTGRIGLLHNAISCRELAAVCEDRLTAHAKFCDAGKPIHRVAVVGGSGGDFIEAAAMAQADCFITGEAGYHDAQKAQHYGISLIVAGHYATENPVCEALQKLLQAQFTKCEFILNDDSRDIFEYTDN